MIPRATASSDGRMSGSSQTERNTPRNRSRGLLDRPATAGAMSVARVDRQLEGGEEEVVLGAEVVVHQRRVDAGGRGDAADRRTGEAVLRERRPGRREDRGAGVGRPAAPTPRRSGGRPLSHATTGRRSARGRTPATRRGRARAPRAWRHLRVLISSTMWPSKPVAGQVPQEGAGLHHAAAGHQVLVLGRAGAVGEVHVAQPRRPSARPSRPASDRAIAACERSIVVLA